MKPFTLAIAAAGMLVGSNLAIAQATQGSVPRAATSNEQAASGDTNQAVVTTSANAVAPAKGANSFTIGEAKSRIEKSGFSNVGELTKDDSGVWHGNAQKAGNSTMVWLDYKGNVGESK